jgi:large subunit ribosomal protein L24
MTIAADIGRATIAGIVARNASARLKVDAGGLQIDRLSVADLGGAAFSASGRIVMTAPSPQGDMRVDLDAPDMAPVMALLARFAPDTAQTLGRGASMMAPAKLRARLTIDGAASPALAKLGLDGSLGKVRVAMNGQANVDSVGFNVDDIKLDGKLDTDDGKALIAVLGFNRALAVEAGPATLTIKTSGPPLGDLQIESRLTAGGLDANIAGTARLFGDSRSAALRTTIVRADIAPLRGAAGSPPLPLAFAARLTLAGTDLSLADINATIGGAALRGKLSATLQVPSNVQGNIEADSADGAALIAAAIGMPASASPKSPQSEPRNTRTGWTWSGEPFAPGGFGDFTGQVALKARRLDASPRLTAREFRAILRFGKDEISVDDVSGEVAGGRLAGRVSFQSTPDGLKSNVKIALTNVDAAAVLPAGARPPVSGSLDFSAETAGGGLSPVALIGSLQGAGKVTLSNGQFSGLDPRTFDAVTRAVDLGLPIDGTRIGDMVQKALDGGQLSIKRAEGTIAVSAGQLWLSNVAVDSKDADLSLSGILDLTDGAIDARMVLSGVGRAAGARPDIFMSLQGPVASPSRTVDVSALTGWLTLRSVEKQTRQLRAIEGQAPKPTVQSPAPKTEQAPALPAPIDIRPAPAPAQ